MRINLSARFFSIFAASIVVLAVGVTPCAALKPAPGEGIASFVSDVTIRKDASIEVREEFVVRSKETYFQYGLVRYLPIGTDARWDSRLTRIGKDDTGIRVKILEVTEDGNPISYEQGSGWGYPQLRIGKFNVPLSRGDHKIVIRYLADGAIEFLEHQDRLYWSAIGHYWGIPIDEVTLRFHFPAGAPVESIDPEVFVGGLGLDRRPKPETEVTRFDSSDSIGYRATHLGPAQTLNLLVSFPKGIVIQPKMGVFSRNRWLLIAPLLIFLYYLILWIRIGPEAPLGSVAVRYEPPVALSPAAVRYVTTGGCDARTLASVIAQLAARECLSIDFVDGKYKLDQLKVDDATLKSLAPEEARVLELLFEDGPHTVLRPNDSTTLNTYLLGAVGQLRIRLDGKYFTSHIGSIVLGYFVSLIIAMSMAVTASGRDTGGVMFLTWWLFFCSSILGVLSITNMVPAVIRVVRGLGGVRELLPGVLFVGAFGAAFVMILRMLARNISPTYSLALAALVGVNLAWGPWFRRLTPLGRDSMREIEGFRQFLETVESDRMERLNLKGEPPSASLEFIPYAIALEVREAWGDHLATALFATTTSR